MKKSMTSFSLLAVLLVPAMSARADFAFDFNNQSDAGLTRVNPLAATGQGGTYSFPSLGGGNFGYQVTQTNIPSGNAAGPARIGSVLSGRTFGDFSVSVDVVAWDNTIGQAFGLLARTTNIGLGTTNGYAFVYQNPIVTGQALGQLGLFRVTGEATSSIGTTADLTFLPGRSYHFLLSFAGSNLTGLVTDLAAPTTVLATIAATDPTYASGAVGIIGAGFPPTGTASSVNVTFDNFVGPGTVPEPGSIALLGLGLAGLGWMLKHRRRR